MTTTVDRYRFRWRYCHHCCYRFKLHRPIRLLMSHPRFVVVITSGRSFIGFNDAIVCVRVTILRIAAFMCSGSIPATKATHHTTELLLYWHSVWCPIYFVELQIQGYTLPVSENPSLSSSPSSLSLSSSLSHIHITDVMPAQEFIKFLESHVLNNIKHCHPPPFFIIMWMIAAALLCNIKVNKRKFMTNVMTMMPSILRLGHYVMMMGGC